MRTSPNSAILRLAVARFISVGGSMAAYAALIDLVFRRTHGSTVVLSLTVLLTMGAVGVFGPIGGAVADRWDRKRAMIASDLLGGALFLVLAFVGPVWLILTVALLTAAAAAPFSAGSTAAIPNLVEDEALIARANARFGIGTTLGITLGPAIGGVLAGWVGAGPVFVLNAVSFAASAALVWSIRAPFEGAVNDEAEHSGARGILAGFRFLRRDRVQLVLTLAWMILLLGIGMAIVADRPLAAIFSVGSIGFGVMLGLYGVGAVVGSWLASRLTAATEPAALVTGFAVAGVAGIGIWLAPVFWIVLVCNIVWGVGDAVTRVAKSGILQRRTPDAVRGRVVGANESALHLALMAGFLAAGPVMAVVGAQATYAVGGLAALGAAVLSSTVVAAAGRDLLAWREVDDRARIRPTVDAKSLERVPLFAGLSHRDRQRVARWADTIDLPAGKHLLDEGRLPHEFFVILDGEVEVTHEGAHLATLSQGDFFGEIALIEHGRRTASVVTSTPTSLAVMSPSSFDAMRNELPRVAERIDGAIRERLGR